MVGGTWGLGAVLRGAGAGWGGGGEAGLHRVLGYVSFRCQSLEEKMGVLGVMVEGWRVPNLQKRPAGE